MTKSSIACGENLAGHKILWTKMYNAGLTPKPSLTGSTESAGPAQAAKIDCPRLHRALFDQAASNCALDRLGAPRHSPRAKSAAAAQESTDETVLFAVLHLVERGDAEHAVLYAPPRRNGRQRTNSATTIIRRAAARSIPALGFVRRWVIYNGQSEASMTPPGLERLAAPHCRYSAFRRELSPARMGAPASAAI